jgi:hypothetical protein
LLAIRQTGVCRGVCLIHGEGYLTCFAECLIFSSKEYDLWWFIFDFCFHERLYV